MNNKELIKRYAELDYPETEHMRDYIMKSTFRVVELSDGSLYRLEKGHMQTDFCFGYGYCGVSDLEDEKRASDMCEYASKSYDYFLKENTKDIERTLYKLELGHPKDNYYNTYHAYITKTSIDKIVGLTFATDTEDLERFGIQYKELTGEDKKAITEAYWELLANKAKRCETWWKKYGAEHLHTWTYLSD